MEKHYSLRLSIIILLLSIFIIVDAKAQWISPGNGSSYTLESLVAESEGAVTLVDEGFLFNVDITLSTSDTLKIMEDIDCFVESGKLITVQGVCISNPPNRVNFFPVGQEPNDFFLGFRFEESDASVLKNTNITGCGGIKLLYSNMLFEDCMIYELSKEYASGAIDLFHANPTIKNCMFLSNDGPAITSGANAESAPLILNNVIDNNNVSNENTPQINLGNSGNDTIKIIGNTVEGGLFNNTGGIAVSTLYGGSCQAIISGNTVEFNRYGIAAIGSDIYTEIYDNIISFNLIQYDPMLGGSGLNFNGGETNTSIVHHNEIYGNLWGVTVQLNARPNLGDITGGTNEGLNVFYSNENGGATYHLYNNTPQDIMAENNFWGTNNPDSIAESIYENADDVSLGNVDYEPYWVTGVGVAEVHSNKKLGIYPNPAKDDFSISKDIINITGAELSIFDLNGKIVKTLIINHQNKVNIENLARGNYFVQLIHNKSTYVDKLIVE